MVAKVICGKSIYGVLRYNENKVKKGCATLLGAEKFGSDGTELTLAEKAQRFALLTRTNKKAKTNAIHISLNFAPNDQLSTDKLRQIVHTYMEGIGFGDQPYLAYEHFDAAHPHVHIVTTNITEDGTRILTNNIGRERSEPVRKAIEQTFGLIPAESRKRTAPFRVTPLDRQRLWYGKLETKAAIVSVVKEVLRSYRFTCLEDYRAILEQSGVTVEGGAPGSRLFDKEGLIYSALDENGQRTGVPIKASDFYFKPTRKRLEQRYSAAAIYKLAYQSRLQGTIDRIMDRALRPQTPEQFVQQMAERNIDVIYRRDRTGQVQSLTYIDNQARVVFSDADLGKRYAPAGIASRMSAPATKDYLDATTNLSFVAGVIAQTDFSATLPQIVASWVQKGMTLRAQTNTDGFTRYWLGRSGSRLATMVEADATVSAWLRANRITDQQTAYLAVRIAKQYPKGIPEAPPTVAGQLLDGLGQFLGQVMTIILSIVTEAFRLSPGAVMSHINIYSHPERRKKAVEEDAVPNNHSSAPTRPHL